jgi:hypothetical protein
MRRRKNAGRKNRFQFQEALSEVAAESRCITVSQPVNTKALTLAGFGGALLTVEYEMASSSFAYCRDASVLKYELSLNYLVEII